MTQWQQMELDELEKRILIAIFGQVTIPEKSAKILNCFKINPNEYFQKLEKKILPVLKDDGYVDAHLLSNMLKVWKPDLQKIIEIPETDFRLVEFADSLVKLILPGFIS